MNDIINTFNQRSKYYITIYILAFLLDWLVIGMHGWTSLVPFKIVPLVIMVIAGNFAYHRFNGSSRKESMRCVFKTMGIIISILTAFILLAVLFWVEARIDLGPIIFY